jgi:hypothetical protein
VAGKRSVYDRSGPQGRRRSPVEYTGDGADCQWLSSDHELRFFFLAKILTSLQLDGELFISLLN